MEIYTNDLINIAIKHSDIIKEKLNSDDYIIEDECCNLQWEIRKNLYEKLSKAFNDIVYRSKTEGVDLHQELFKTINDL